MREKAPGKPFRKGVSLRELRELFPDEDTAEHWFEEQRWGQAGKPSCCPLCSGTEKIRRVPSGRPLPYWCGGCRRNFSVRIGTVMQRSKINYQKWAIGICLWITSPKEVSGMKLHRDLKITQKSAYFMVERLRAGRSDADKTAVLGADDFLCLLEGDAVAGKNPRG